MLSFIFHRQRKSINSRLVAYCCFLLHHIRKENGTRSNMCFVAVLTRDVVPDSFNCEKKILLSLGSVFFLSLRFLDKIVAVENIDRLRSSLEFSFVDLFAMRTHTSTFLLDNAFLFDSGNHASALIRLVFSPDSVFCS